MSPRNSDFINPNRHYIASHTVATLFRHMVGGLLAWCGCGGCGGLYRPCAYAIAFSRIEDLNNLDDMTYHKRYPGFHHRQAACGLYTGNPKSLQLMGATFVKPAVVLEGTSRFREMELAL
jgi:hypothetical protein